MNSLCCSLSLFLDAGPEEDLRAGGEEGMALSTPLPVGVRA